MPPTPFTALCEQYCDLIQRVRHELIEVQVLPTVDAQLPLRHPSIRKRDNVYKVAFLRILRWLHTFERLNGDMHIQAVGAGARAVYELYLDLQWFKSFTDDKYLDRYREYTDVDRYLIARKAIDRRVDADCRISDSAIQPIVDSMKALDEKAKNRGFDSMRGLVLKFWGANSAGEPKWPAHWAGQGNLRDRAKAIGGERLDEYYLVYPMLCALVHPGPTPEVGAELSDPIWRERLVSFCYGQTYRLAKVSTELFVDLVDVRSHLVGYAAALRQLDLWEHDARSAAPTA
jgi:hypothetical protein